MTRASTKLRLVFYGFKTALYGDVPAYDEVVRLDRVTGNRRKIIARLRWSLI
jgi:hypothetical protein